MPVRPTVILVTVVSALAVLAGCGDDEGAARPGCAAALVEQIASAPHPTGLRWVDCDDAQVAALSVSADRDAAATSVVTLALARHPATGERIGSLVVNPGGPGASALELALRAPEFLPTALTERFDVITWDPRGVGLSNGVDCVDDDAMARFWAADRSPDDRAEVTEVLAAGEAIADGCATNEPALLPHLSTRRTVEDLEAIRAALGEDQISYLGFSYGTLIGAQYADRYPARVRAMVLDGAVDPSLTTAEATRDQAAGFEDALHTFLDVCATDEDCTFSSGGDPQTAYDRTMEGIDAEELYAIDAAGEERGLGPGEADLGVAEALYSGREGWPELASALVGAARGDGSELLQLADQYVQRSAAGEYSNDLEASYAIGCLDSDRLAVDELEALADELAVASPRLGPATAWYGTPCTFWAAPPDFEPPADVMARGASPIVVIGTVGDPATPYEWSRALAGRLESGVLLTVEGDAHTAVGSGNDCVDEAVARALIETSPPGNGARC